MVSSLQFWVSSIYTAMGHHNRLKKRICLWVFATLQDIGMLLASYCVTQTASKAADQFQTKPLPVAFRFTALRSILVPRGFFTRMIHHVVAIVEA